MITITLLSLFFLSINFGFSQQISQDYLFFGQPLPGDSAIIFAPGLISPNDNIFSVTFSPEKNESFLITYNEKSSTILHSMLINSTWTKFDTSFLANEKNLEIITISPDGQLLTFTKSNPIEGWPYNTDLYYCSYTDSGWSKPQPFSAVINSEFREAGHALTLDKTLYFASGRPTDDSKADIFKAKCVNGKYESAEYVPNLSTSADEDGIWISPDESYAIVESWQDANKKDLYIAFRKPDGIWTKQKNMGTKINTPGFEGSPKVTSDGKYLNFWSDRSGKACVYWIMVDKIINELREEVVYSQFRCGVE